jgi:hypothetical protein
MSGLCRRMLLVGFAAWGVLASTGLASRADLSTRPLASAGAPTLETCVGRDHGSAPASTVRWTQPAEELTDTLDGVLAAEAPAMDALPLLASGAHSTRLLLLPPAPSLVGRHVQLQI